jgi:rubrerythrin
MSDEPSMADLRAEAKGLEIAVPFGTTKVQLGELVAAKRAELDAASPVEEAASEPTDQAADASETDTAADAAAASPADDAESADADAEELDELEAEPGDRVVIARTDDRGTWWCPICDHSQTGLVRACGNCGAARDGDVVVAPTAWKG